MPARHAADRRRHSRRAAPRRAAAAPSGRRRPASRRRSVARLAALLLPALLAIAVYLPSLPNDLVWDDLQLIVQNRFLRDGDLAALVTHGIFAGAGRDVDFYRPLQMLSYRADLAVWGDQPLRPWTLRLSNLLLHALNSLLVLWVFDRLWPGRRRAAWAAALLFAVHPAASESVVYVAGRADLLLLAASLGCIGSWIAYLADRRPWQLALSGLCYALALLAKEMALVVPLLLALVTWVVPAAPAGGRPATARRSAGRPWPVLGVHLALAAGYLALRASLLGEAGGGAPAGLDLPAIATTYASYARILLWPDVLHMERLVLPDPWRDPGYLLPWLLLVALVAVLVRRPDDRRPVVVAVAWFAVGLLPVSNLWKLNAAMAEHWLYLPGLGLFWLVGLGFDRLAAAGGELRWLARGALAVAVVLLGVRSVRRCADWRDSATLFAATLEHAPSSARAHTGLGAALGRAGRLDAAIEHLRQAVALDPTNADALNNLGAAFGRRGDLDSCVVYLERALALVPGNADTHNNLGNAYAILGRPRAAAEAYRAALARDPHRASIYLNLGRVCQVLGDRPAARVAYQRFLELADPADLEGREQARRALRELEERVPVDDQTPDGRTPDR